MIRYCNCRSIHELYTGVPSVWSTLRIPKTAVGWIPKFILFGGPEFKFWLRYRSCHYCQWQADSSSSSEKKIPAFCETRRFITAFTTVRHVYLSWARTIQYTLSYQQTFQYYAPEACNVTEDRSPASHCGGPGWVTGQSMRNMSWTVALGHFTKTALPFTPWSLMRSSSFTISNQNHEAYLFTPISATCPAYRILLHFTNLMIFGKK